MGLKTETKGAQTDVLKGVDEREVDSSDSGVERCIQTHLGGEGERERGKEKRKAETQDALANCMDGFGNGAAENDF
jgi:hypothetical protein